MPALLVDTSTCSASTSPSAAASTPSDRPDKERSRSRSPDRPPVSPITPTATVAQLAPLPPSESRTRVVPPPVATFIPQPPSVAINESENTDAIALRSAISLLQLQREKSKRDLKALEELKAAAVADPRGWARALQEQRAAAAKVYTANPLAPTLADMADATRNEGEGEEDEDPQHANGAARKDSAAVDASPEKARFAPIPTPQNIVRCPPVNWEKYHVVGESLDKLHDEQKKYPGAAEPPRTHRGTRAPPHAISAPYSPFNDGIGERSPPRNLKKSPP
ncbi:hypothetical protein P280DRAFT_473856 [Massarina eburnea CBS 473.64]|uniref:Uncharacterized protein n=1 Tax=Massarina eburnea CBS 473.64 TaxID=1395130 RepID=A0A6A6RID9_9PLEO|nr:hypothetical protein P280DRAFT_473856 [Massarina eburnea CBS 473.64]